MKNLKIFLPVLVLLMGMFSCSDFGDVNTDPKSPTEADASYLFTSATKAYSDWYVDADVNSNVSRLAAQYWSQVTYTSESRYDWDSRQIADAMWAQIYRDCLKDLSEARTLNEAAVDPAVKAGNEAVITIFEVMVYQTLVDCFGDIPYKEALTGEDIASPVYDDAKTIYTDIAAKLRTALGTLAGGATCDFGSSDPVYSGDVAAWTKLGKSLQLRLGIRLADTDAAAAKDLIESGYAGAMGSSADNAYFPYFSGTVNGHPLYSTLVTSGRHDYVPSNTLVDYMNGLNDPRRNYYMTLDLANDSIFIGNTYGSLASVPFGDYSQVNPTLEDPTTSGELMTFAEVAFILAEAADRGMAVGGTAEEWYNIGVEASITKWGGSATEVTDYMAQPEVAFATAEGGDAMKAIAMQRWIALYNDGMQGWIEWKRTDYPTLNVPEELTAADIPVRYKYPTNEPSLNGTNYTAASSKIGGDLFSTKVFWDAN